MPRDYASKTHSKSKPSSAAPGWAWLVTGLLIGLFVAFLVYLNQGGSVGQRDAPPDTSQDARAVRPAPGKEIPTPPKPRFDFYTLLPEMEVAVPDEGSGGKARPAQPLAKVDDPGNYVLQVGSFKNYKDADAFKASLALLGLEAEIQTVTIDGKDTWHRVRIGPIGDLDELNRTRSRLKEHDIDAMLLKLKS